MVHDPGGRPLPAQLGKWDRSVHHAAMQTILRVVIGWAVAGWLGAHAHAGEKVHVDGFDMMQVCACDCVNQYELRVQRPDDVDVICRGLRDDGEWTDIKPSPYTPADPSGLLFHTRDHYTEFTCERRSRL